MPNSHRDPLPPLDEQQRYRVDEGARYLRVSVPGIYRRIRAGEIVTIVEGRRRFIPGSELVRLSRAPAAAA